jgi:RNA-binding protein 39
VQEEGPRTLYVGSLHQHIKERDLKAVFEPFGELDFINLHVDEKTGASKGYAFVQFQKADSAKAAFARLNGLELAGSKIRVGLVKDMAAVDQGWAALDEEDALGTIRMNAQSRALLMSKLQRSEEAKVEPQPLPLVPRSTDAISACVLITNMFDPLEEEPGFEKPLEDDVMSEAARNGQVQHLRVDPNSAGFVYMKFGSTDAASKAVTAFNGRFFGGRQISAQVIPEQRYVARWPDAPRR